MNRLDALINDIICIFLILSRLSIFNTGYQVFFEDVGGSLGNMFFSVQNGYQFILTLSHPVSMIYTEFVYRHLIFGGFMVMSFI